MPIRGGYADEVCIVTSGEMMSLYAAVNIAHAVKSFGKRGYASLRGLILNAKNIEGENELVDKAAAEIDVQVLYRLPRDPFVQQAEAQGQTVVEAFPALWQPITNLLPGCCWKETQRHERAEPFETPVGSKIKQRHKILDARCFPWHPLPYAYRIGKCGKHRGIVFFASWNARVCHTLTAF
jgi:hypothetical protein